MVALDAGWSDLGSWVSLRAQEENQLPSLYGNSSAPKIERPLGVFPDFDGKLFNKSKDYNGNAKTKTFAPKA